MMHQGKPSLLVNISSKMHPYHKELIGQLLDQSSEQTLPFDEMKAWCMDKRTQLLKQ